MRVLVASPILLVHFGCAQQVSEINTSPYAGTPNPPLPDLSAWAMHDMDRPQPDIVDPGIHQGLQQTAAPAPSDAIILFDGTDLSAWESTEGGDAPWRIVDGAMEIVPDSGEIRTRQGFGDVQLHIEFAAPAAAVGSGQDRGNSGVFLMSEYEVQVLDSYENTTYPDGQAAAIYGQYPPLVNASRPPGTWQTYDVIFNRPRFDADGTLLSPARATVLHNGVLVQNNVVLSGPTQNQERPPYEAHPDRLPIELQDHDHPVRYRNIWVRELE